MLGEGDMVVWVVNGEGCVVEMRVVKIAVKEAFETPHVQAELAKLKDKHGQFIKHELGHTYSEYVGIGGVLLLEMVCKDTLLMLQKGKTGYEAWLQVLRTLLLSPLEHALSLCRQEAGPTPEILIVAHGPLHLAPWPAIFAQKGVGRGEGGGVGGGGWKVRLAPSIQVLALLRHRDACARPLQTSPGAVECLVVGNPVPLPLRDPYRLGELPGAEEEASRVSLLLQSSPGMAAAVNVTVLLNEAAVKSKVMEQMEKSSWIHLACHAHPNVRTNLYLAPHLRPIDESSTRQALFLSTSGFNHPSTGEGVDQDKEMAKARGALLTVDDILEMKLKPGCVVVLSACSTALGEVKGEGVIGLGRAFLLAGASSVVCTLWEVKDSSQLLLMQRFYALVRKGLDLCSALHHAQLSLRLITESQLAKLEEDEQELHKWRHSDVTRGPRKDLGTSNIKTVTVAAVGGGVGVETPPPPSSLPSASQEACPYEHYKHWGGVMLLGSALPSWRPGV